MINRYGSLFGQSLRCRTRLGDSYQIERLSRERAKDAAAELLELHNGIPHVRWDEARLLADRSEDGHVEYLGKWEISLVALREGRPIGLLIAYFKGASEEHPAQAAYIHRLAVDRRARGQGIGSHLVGYFLEELFNRVPWLLTVTVQTNDEDANDAVLRFYDDFRFKRVHRVYYPNKVDCLFELPRDEFRWAHRAGRAFERVHLPAAASWPAPVAFPSPFPVGDVDGEAPRLYFRTGSHEKRDQYRYLLRCYGMELVVPRLTISLTEPQIEGVGPEPERELVTGPLKLMSPFAAKAATFPLAVEDTMLFVEKFNREFAAKPLLPGPDTKRWWAALGDEGLVEAMGASGDRRAARYVCQIGVLVARGRYLHFRSELPGRIADQPRRTVEAVSFFPYSNATYFHSVFIPDGSSRTLAEMSPDEFVLFDYRRRCVSSLVASAEEVFLNSAAPPQLF